MPIIPLVKKICLIGDIREQVNHTSMDKPGCEHSQQVWHLDGHATETTESDLSLAKCVKSSFFRHWILRLIYHAHTIYLFTCDNHQIIVLPWTIAGFADALTSSVLMTDQNTDYRSIISRFPHALLWMWLNILAFAITNQRSFVSIAEDSRNKPWRPLPSGRLTALQARNLLLVVVPLVFLITTYLGAGQASLLALTLNWMYNDLGGSDIHYVVRNLINALAMVVATAGTTEVATQSTRQPPTFNTTGYQWLGMKAVIIFTTLQTQDLRDQAGDLARARSTVPLALGDSTTRWTISIPVLFWSLFCPYFWQAGFGYYCITFSLGSFLSLHLLSQRSIASDQFSWQLWGIWTLALFLAPLSKYVTL